LSLSWIRPDYERDYLAGFRNSTDIAIESIRQALYSSVADPRDALDEAENEAVFYSSFDSDDEKSDDDRFLLRAPKPSTNL
jgi:hypothetical protein